jgi:hypothetical protein
VEHLALGALDGRRVLRPIGRHVAAALPLALRQRHDGLPFELSGSFAVPLVVTLPPETSKPPPVGGGPVVVGVGDR